jgi:D-serine deaminase-like pyridoxal phosphate-dependent protein
MDRRKALKTGLLGFGAIALGGYLLKPKSKGKKHNAYFTRLNLLFKNYKNQIPFLLIDLDILDQNIVELKKMIRPNVNYRIVVKSLPSPELIDYVMQKAGTNKLMCFHQPFLSVVSEKYGNDIDILMGKPMPVNTVEYYYTNLKSENGFDPEKQLQWLIDTTERLNEYLFLAKSLQKKLLISIEIDVGLHRGGVNSTKEVRSMLQTIIENKNHLTFSGFMGYDPHLTKIPSFIESSESMFNEVCDLYNQYKNVVKNEFPSLWHNKLTFNGAGSPTLVYHQNEKSPLNDVSAGSCLVKPTSFDISQLEKFKPASFITTPILKKIDGFTIPAMEKIAHLISWFNSNYQTSYYIYGGSWDAKYVSPEGISENAIIGKSTNQVLINSSKIDNLGVNDQVFLRPTQSEFVFLQFGKILAIRENEITEWETLNSI